ncbi:MAG: glycosyltransferase [Proteobacteria bacterium]|nr:glycosyltransferase [Pseudomonadota bacterium]MBU1686742.1 glycosyltransferase [Pseudomonadota bacterium]
MISIVIPVYNSENQITRLLDSIKQSRVEDEIEVVVVDDASKDGTVEAIKQYPVRIYENDTNYGSAYSRNRGVKEACGDLIVFFDADVVLKDNTLQSLIARSEELSDKDAYIGIYSKDPVEKGFVPEFKALLDFSHWLYVQSREVTSFEPRCAILRKKAFLDVGGFDEKIKGADVEDYEFGYRLLAAGGKIYLDKNIQVDHHFPLKMTTIVKNFFQRGASWIKLFLQRKEFDNVATTKGAGAACIMAFVSFLLFFPGVFVKEAAFLWVSSMIIYVILIHKFMGFVLREKGVHFMLLSFFAQYLLNVVLGVAAVKGVAEYILQKMVGICKT